MFFIIILCINLPASGLFPDICFCFHLCLPTEAKITDIILIAVEAIFLQALYFK